jgi:hypothetical protein
VIGLSSVTCNTALPRDVDILRIPPSSGLCTGLSEPQYSSPSTDSDWKSIPLLLCGESGSNGLKSYLCDRSAHSPCTPCTPLAFPPPANPSLCPLGPPTNYPLLAAAACVAIRNGILIHSMLLHSNLNFITLLEQCWIVDPSHYRP